MKKLKQPAITFALFALLLSACGGAVPVDTQAPPTQAPATEIAAATEAPVSGEPELCSAEATNTGSDTELIIGTGGTGGVFYPLGEGLANILTANTPGVTFTF